jgi:hypothetical protein
MEKELNIFEETRKYLQELSIKIDHIDSTRPWGGFFVIDEIIKPSVSETTLNDSFKLESVIFTEQ